MHDWKRPNCPQCIEQDSVLFKYSEIVFLLFALTVGLIMSAVFITAYLFAAKGSANNWTIAMIVGGALLASFSWVYALTHHAREIYIFHDDEGSVHVHDKQPMSGNKWRPSGWISWVYSTAHGTLQPTRMASADRSVAGHVIKYRRFLRIPGTSWNHQIFDVNGHSNGLRISGQLQYLYVHDENGGIIGQLTFTEALTVINQFMSVSRYREYHECCAKQRETLGVLIMAAVYDLKGSKTRKPSTGMAYTRQLIEAGLTAARIDISMIDRWQTAAQKLHAELTVPSTTKKEAESATTA